MRLALTRQVDCSVTPTSSAGTGPTGLYRSDHGYVLGRHAKLVAEARARRADEPKARRFCVDLPDTANVEVSLGEQTLQAGATKIAELLGTPIPK